MVGADLLFQQSSRNPSLTFPFLKEISGRERALGDVLQHWGPVLPYKCVTKTILAVQY